MLLFCFKFFTSHSYTCLVLRFVRLPSQVRAGLCLVSCVLQRQTKAVAKPLCSTYSYKAKYLQGTVRQTKTPASKINWPLSFFILKKGRGRTKHISRSTLAKNLKKTKQKTKMNVKQDVKSKSITWLLSWMFVYSLLAYCAVKAKMC